MIPFDEIVDHVDYLIEDIQSNLFKKALNFRSEHTTDAESYDSFKELIKVKGGFVSAHWDGTVETELRVKEETSATIRCIPIKSDKKPGLCIFTGKPSKQKVLFAKAY